MKTKSKSLAAAWMVMLFAGTAAILSACDESPRTQRIYHGPYGSHPALLTAASNGENVPVHVVGQISDSPDKIARLYAEWLGAQDQHLRFEAGSNEIPAPGSVPWVLILHDTPPGYTGISACQGDSYEPEESTTERIFRTIVCDESGRLIEILGAIPVGQPDLEGVYRSMLEDTARRMITEEDSSERR